MAVFLASQISAQCPSPYMPRYFVGVRIDNLRAEVAGTTFKLSWETNPVQHSYYTGVVQGSGFVRVSGPGIPSNLYWTSRSGFQDMDDLDLTNGRNLCRGPMGQLASEVSGTCGGVTAACINTLEPLPALKECTEYTVPCSHSTSALIYLTH